MLKAGRLLSSLLLISTVHGAHAARETDGPTPPKPGQELSTRGGEVDVGGGCKIGLDPTIEGIEKYLPIEKADDAISDLVVNGPRKIVGRRYAEGYDENRAAQLEAGKALAREIADQVFALVGDKNKADQIQDIIMLRLGQLPDRVLDDVQSLIEIEALANVGTYKEDEAFKRRTDNAIADVTRIMTQFRDKTMADKSKLDTNKVANFLDRFRNLPRWGGFFGDAGDYVRKNYQSVQYALKQHREVFTQAIDKRRERQVAYREGRELAENVQRYEEISAAVATELYEIFTTAVKETKLNDNQRAWVNQVILLPNQSILTTIRGNQDTVLKAYLGLGKITDLNRLAILALYNTKSSSGLKLALGSVLKQATNQIEATIDALHNVDKLSNQVMNEAVDDIIRIGVKMEDYAQYQVDSVEDAMNATTKLINGLELAKSTTANRITIYEKANARFAEMISDLQAKGAALESIDQIKLADQAFREVTGRSVTEASEVPQIKNDEPAKP